MVRLSIQTPIRDPLKKRKPAVNLFAVKRDQLIRSAGVVEEAHAVAEAAWFRARDAVWVWPSDDGVNGVNQKWAAANRLFAKNMPAEADSVPSLHIELGAYECALGGNEQRLAVTGLSDLAAEDADGRHLSGFQIHSHRDTLRARRSKVSAKELRRLRGGIRARLKNEPDILSSFDRAEVAKRVLIPSEYGPARLRRKPPGCNVVGNGDDFSMKLLRRDRYHQRYKVEVAGYAFDLTAKWRKPLSNPSWPVSEPRLETLARGAELWIMPSFFVESETEGVFSIIDLLDHQEELALAA